MTEKVSETKLRQILKTARKATPGPWVYRVNDDDQFLENASGVDIVSSGYTGELLDGRDDLEHIANCDPTTIMELIGELLMLRAQLKETP